MKLLITGATGQLGTELVSSARPHQVLGLAHSDLEVTERQQVESVFVSFVPDVVIHAAAWTAVDACESDPKKAMGINRDGTANIVRAARMVGARVLYISTDYVFDGTKSGPYLETDTPNPTSVYGASKLAGEKQLDPAIDMIIRISWVCGFHGKNMVKTILQLARTKNRLSFVDDQIGSPTFVSEAAPRIIDMAVAQLTGIWHLTNQGVTSWFGFARDVLAAADLDPNRVDRIRTSELVPQRPARRPENSVLANERIRQANLPLLSRYHIPLSQLVHRLTS